MLSEEHVLALSFGTSTVFILICFVIGVLQMVASQKKKKKNKI